MLFTALQLSSCNNSICDIFEATGLIMPITALHFRFPRLHRPL